MMENLSGVWRERVRQNHYCSVNATAALNITTFRAIFDDCAFQSSRLMTRKLTDGGPNPLWDKLGCVAENDDYYY